MKSLLQKGIPMMFALILLTLNACKDPCKDIVCLNGGVCVDGDCTCTEWYEGELCADNILDAYIDTYEGLVTDNYESYIGSYTLSREDDLADNELFALGSSEVLDFTMQFSDRNLFEIKPEVITVDGYGTIAITGSGLLTETKLEYIMSVSVNGYLLNFSGTMFRQ